MFRHFYSVESKNGLSETTWVISDYTATAGTNELSVSKGQQVEVVDSSSAANDSNFCLVRLTAQSGDDAAIQEGLVPISILKPTPGSHKSQNTNHKKDKNEIPNEQSNNQNKLPDTLTSSTKRRGLGGRKWLPQIGRKPALTKIDKMPDKSLNKKSSEKNFKLPASKQSEDIMAIGNTTQMTANAVCQLNTSLQDFELDEEAGLELPPPMKPIQEPHLMANGPPTYKKDMKNTTASLGASDKMDGLSEIEQIVKEKTEKHEEKSKIINENNKHIEALGGGSSSGGGKTYETNANNMDAMYGNSDGHNSATNNGDIKSNAMTTNSSSSNEMMLMHKNRFPALSELISSEEVYIKDLGEIVNGYMAELRNVNNDIPLPHDLKGPKWLIVFANIEAIYEWHRDYFLKALLQCQKCPRDLSALIKRYEHKFQMYITYCSNKPKSEHIVTEHLQYFNQVRQKLGHRLDLSDLLIKPVQRLTKYVLLLSAITKQIEQAGLLDEVPNMKEACNMMNAICKDVNDIMVLRRLKNFDGNITSQGKLLLHGTLTCIENLKNAGERKMRDMHVFLFEQSIIFTEKHTPKMHFANPTYIYRSHIQVNKMHFEELPNNRFLLRAIDANRPELNIICYAATIDLHREWLDTIRKQLQIQHDFLNALIRPIAYQQQQQQQQQYQQQQCKAKQNDLKSEHSRESL